MAKYANEYSWQLAVIKTLVQTSREGYGEPCDVTSLSLRPLHTPSTDSEVGLVTTTRPQKPQTG